MSRRKPPQSRLSCGAIVALLFLVILLAGALWRVYPEYQRLKRRWQEQASARQTGVTNRPVPSPQPLTPAPEATATLYFARVVDGEQRLVAVHRGVPPSLGIARAALGELIEGDIPVGCERPLPPGTKLLGITVADGLATVDFSRELVTGFPGGSDNEGVTVYAIVDTLTSLPAVERVRLLVEGKPVTTIGGHLDLSTPLKFDGELVVK